MKPIACKTQARRYLKVVEWSDRDQCYIGSAPPIIGRSCHGKTEAEVLRQLNVIVEDWVEILLREGNPLPAPSVGKSYSGKFLGGYHRNCTRRQRSKPWPAAKA